MTQEQVPWCLQWYFIYLVWPLVVILASATILGFIPRVRKSLKVSLLAYRERWKKRRAERLHERKQERRRNEVLKTIADTIIDDRWWRESLHQVDRSQIRYDSIIGVATGNFHPGKNSPWLNLTPEQAARVLAFYVMENNRLRENIEGRLAMLEKLLGKSQQ